MEPELRTHHTPQPELDAPHDHERHGRPRHDTLHDTLNIPIEFLHELHSRLHLGPQFNQEFMQSILGFVVGLLGLAILLISLYKSDYTDAETWSKYQITFLFAAFIIHHIVHHCIQYFVSEKSVLFHQMPLPLQRHDTNFLVIFLQFWFWFPFNTFLVVETFRRGPRELANDLEFQLFSRVALMMYLINEWYDLTQRKKFDRMLHYHHIGATILVLLVLEWLQDTLEQRDAGLYLIGMQSAMDKLIYIIFPFDHVVRQHYTVKKEAARQSLKHKHSIDQLHKKASTMMSLSKKAISKKDERPDNTQHPFLNHTFVTKLYFCAFWYYVIFVRILVISLTVAYVVAFRDEIDLLWKIALPCFVVFFNLTDVLVYKLLYVRGYNKQPHSKVTLEEEMEMLHSLHGHSKLRKKQGRMGEASFKRSAVQPTASTSTQQPTF